MTAWTRSALRGSGAAWVVGIALLGVFRITRVRELESQLATRMHIGHGTALEAAVNFASTRSIIVVTVLAAVNVAWFGVRGRWRAVLTLGLIVVGGVVLFLVVRDRISGPRPPDVDGLGLGTSWRHPSGHAFIAATVATLAYTAVVPVIHRARTALAAVVILMPVVVSALRLLNGEHYVGDVLTGLSFGVAWAGLGLAISALIAPPGRRVDDHCQTQRSGHDRAVGEELEPPERQFGVANEIEPLFGDRA